MIPGLRLAWVLPCLALAAACEKKPTNVLVNPNPTNAVPVSGTPFVVYADELNTGGGVGIFPSEANQEISVDSTDRPHNGRRAVRYSWNGKTVPQGGTAQHAFAGFSLIVSVDLDHLASTPGRDLSGAEYDRVRFWIRGSLSENTTVKVEGPDDGLTSTAPPSVTITSLSDTWQEFSVDASPGDFFNVKEFFKLTFVYTQPTGTTAAGDGGTVFVDDVRFER